MSASPNRLEKRVKDLEQRVAELQQVEQALEESEERLQLALRGADMGMWGWNVQTGEIYGDQRIADMLDERLEEIVHELPSWIDCVHPEDLHRVRDGILRHFSGEDEFYEIEHRLRNKHGRWIWINVRGKITKEDEYGRPLWMTGTYLDITERKSIELSLKETEQQFRFVVENSLTAISILQGGVFVFQNPEHGRIFYLDPDSGQTPEYADVHPDDLQSVIDNYHQIMDGHEQEVEFDFRVRARDGECRLWKWMACRATRIEYQGGPAALVNLMDVTRARELEHMVRTEDKMASLGRVAAGIAHEIRNPLSGINIYIGALKKICVQHECPRSMEILDQIESASSRIEGVIRRVMDFSKPSEPRRSMTDVNALIEESLDLCAVTLRKAGIDVDRDLAEHLPPCPADPQMIEEVLLNLLTNAAEAMETGPGERRMCVTTDLCGDAVYVRVADNGPGIPEKLQQQVFEPFFTTKNDGTGIGLSLSHRIVHDHGGVFAIKPSPMGGAQFEFSIPLRRGGSCV